LPAHHEKVLLTFLRRQQTYKTLFNKQEVTAMAWKKCFSEYCIVGIVVLSFAGLAWGAAAAPVKPGISSAKIGQKELVGATGVTIIKDDLASDGDVLIKGTAQGGGQRVTKVEVSVDNGKTWKEARGGEKWQYSFTPAPDKPYELIARVTTATGIASDPRAFKPIPLTYRPISLSELIQQQADELAKAYMSRDVERYMALISKDYHRFPEDWFSLRQAITNDFRTRQNITLLLTVDQVFEVNEAIMANVQWRLTYAGLARPKEGYMEIQFDPVNQLKILVQEKDRYFGAP
jgi:hypothetical protein